MSLLKRINNDENTNDDSNNSRPTFGTRPPSNDNNQQNNNGNNPFNRPSSGNRPTFGQANSTSNNNQQQQNNNGGSRFPSRFGAARVQANDVIIPIQKTVVRFELNGLGDPFFHLLNHDLSTDLSDIKEVIKALESGGDAVAEITEILDETWKKYGFSGAALVYGYNKNVWDQAATTTLRPKDQDNLFDDVEEEENPKPEPPTYEVIRAINLQVVLNVLARARSQVLLATAPLVFSQQYLARVILSDDPRLIRIVKATGFMPC